MKTFRQEKDFWFSSEGFLGQSFSFQTLDLEIEDNLEMYLDSFLKTLSPDVRVKISLFQELSNKCEFPSSRMKAVSEKGFLNTKGLIHFEHKNKLSPRKVLKMNTVKKEELFTKQLSDIKESKDNIFLERLRSKPLSSSFFTELYTLHKPLEMTSLGLKSSFALLGILKLKNSGNFPLTLRTLPFALEGLPKPLSFHISMEKMSPAQAEKILQSKSREEAEGKGQVSFEKYQNTQKALSDVALAGEELFHFEVHITLRRIFDNNLRKDIILSLKNLSGLGEWSIESFGAYPSLMALSPGSRLHYKLIEKSSALKCFIPFLRFGASISEGKEDITERSSSKGNFLYHRRDLSLDVLNPFSQSYSNHTGVIIGKSGKGKSVFANLLTRSLFHDKKATVFLVDVKGSHKRTVKALKGKTYNIDIKNSSGLNPLRHLTTDKDSIEIASHFLEKLFLKEGEEFLPSDDKTKLEKGITEFSKSGVNKTLDNFYNTLKHDRRDKLLRWIKGSLNENIFNSNEDVLKNRLLYFNFENISTASNSGTAKAIIAAIMAEFSFKLLNKNPDEKFIFISDETPFFIKSCFNTFSLLSKNVRKLNGSLILLAQTSRDLIVGGDTSLIDNSEFKILFSSDGEEKKFKETFSLTEEEFYKLKNIKTVKGQFSQFLLKDSIGCKIGFLRLSKEEYILSNTEPEFLHKVQNLRKLLGVSEDKALRVMRYV